jgi:hypothetical protein
MVVVSAPSESAEGLGLDNGGEMLFLCHIIGDVCSILGYETRTMGVKRSDERGARVIDGSRKRRESLLLWDLDS